MNNPLECVGLTCERGKQIALMQSPAGFYVGTFDDEGPCCRLTEYSEVKDSPLFMVERECEENQHCNGGSIRGCRVCYSPRRNTLIGGGNPS